MGLHMVAALAKLHLQFAGHGLRPPVAGFASILILKLLMGFRIFRDEARHQSTLFLFRLTQIAFNREPPLSNLARMERAMRLIFTTLPVTPPTRESQIEQEDTFHALSMLAL